MDFDCIYKSYYLDVYHFLCGLSSNKEIAEDITQETFTKALTAINSYDGRKDIRAWLHFAPFGGRKCVLERPFCGA